MTEDARRDGLTVFVAADSQSGGGDPDVFVAVGSQWPTHETAQWYIRLASCDCLWSLTTNRILYIYIYIYYRRNTVSSAQDGHAAGE